jgi:phosphinothricin acetyltransferase
LLSALIDASEGSGIWMIQSSIFPENTATRALHASVGFREVGYREKIACHYGIWRDTILIERRSKIVGV